MSDITFNCKKCGYSAWFQYANAAPLCCPNCSGALTSDAQPDYRVLAGELARALVVYADPGNFVEGNDWLWVGDDDPKETATRLLSRPEVQALLGKEEANP